MNSPFYKTDHCREKFHCRVQGERALPALIYLPGLHGDWLLNANLRASLEAKVCFIEFSYPQMETLTLADYAEGIAAVLAREGIHKGWLLGESFGSQVAWAFLTRCAALPQDDPPAFEPQGLILAGGFVRYPFAWGVRLVRHLHRGAPLGRLMAGLQVYLKLLRWRHRHSPAALESLNQHLVRHNNEQMRRAIVSRYDLILASDPRDFARQFRRPTYYLSGFWDVIVMWFLVQPWLKRNCPGYRGWKLIFSAEHNVLGTQPEKSAHLMVNWITDSISQVITNRPGRSDPSPRIP